MKAIVVLSITLCISIHALAQYQKVALVIGNADYKEAPLINPVNDANDISRALSQLGFEVIIKTNVTRDQFKAAIREFDDKLSSTNGVGLFYFAGHGIQYDGDNHLVPIDADIQRAYEIEDQTIEMQMILKLMEYKKNPMNIVILDACRNNPYTRSFRDMERGLQAPKIAPRGSFIAFATAPGDVAADGEGDNGLYTQELIKALSEPNIPIEQVFKNVRIEVADKSKNAQIPWENSSLTGDFVFNEGIQLNSNNKDKSEGNNSSFNDTNLNRSFFQLKSKAGRDSLATMLKGAQINMGTRSQNNILIKKKYYIDDLKVFELENTPYYVIHLITVDTMGSQKNHTIYIDNSTGEIRNSSSGLSDIQTLLDHFYFDRRDSTFIWYRNYTIRRFASYPFEIIGITLSKKSSHQLKKINAKYLIGKKAENYFEKNSEYFTKPSAIEIAMEKSFLPKSLAPSHTNNHELLNLVYFKIDDRLISLVPISESGGYVYWRLITATNLSTN